MGVHVSASQDRPSRRQLEREVEALEDECVRLAAEVAYLKPIVDLAGSYYAAAVGAARSSEAEWPDEWERWMRLKSESAAKLAGVLAEHNALRWGEATSDG